MENAFLKFLKLNGLFENIKGYIDKRLQLFKLEAMEKASNIVASLSILFLLAFMFLMMLLFFSLALGSYLNHLLESTYMGYVVLTVFFFLVVILLTSNISNGFLHRKIRNILLHILTKK
jgi:hypothetical protein